MEKDLGLVPHVRRPALSSTHPVHVTLRMRREVWQLRSRRCFQKIRRALVELTRRRGVGFVHFSVQGKHIHLIAEASDRSALSRGVQALAIRIARGLNAVMGRRGKVFAERYHEHVLKTPLEPHRALAYVLRNHAKHAAQWGGTFAAIDPYSSAPWFSGWNEPMPLGVTAQGPPLVKQATTWLMKTGWKRHGRIALPHGAT